MGKDTLTEAYTKDDLVNALRKLGVGPGQILEVHSSLSTFGYLIGGARTVVDALMEIAQDGGTIIMPTQTGNNSEPSAWCNPPISPDLWQKVRDNEPAYNPERTDLSGMGEVVENFRHRPGVVFSNHPSVSYAAWGRYAKLLCNRQSLHFPLSEESPAARLYELKGFVLMLGTKMDSVTCMHLAEYRSDCRPIVIQGASVNEDGKRVWKKYLDLDIDSSDFGKVLPAMQKKGLVRESKLGGCEIRFFPANAAIDEATSYFEKTVVYDLYR
ncbi:MAG: AAC(3) family N-acetyltransferase [Solobacterium sp.]|jgi:aminoglycoside 3-N-acetyltransferase|nr:AAC(3) family N-acetyltransferase [Solobacterium sp.]MCH4223307.1 AAC(3) family N-acetyltransferase [Solobacterium sp.]